jgi:predicted GIY-YIG superfamily endonuclease
MVLNSKDLANYIFQQVQALSSLEQEAKSGTEAVYTIRCGNHYTDRDAFVDELEEQERTLSPEEAQRKTVANLDNVSREVVQQSVRSYSYYCKYKGVAYPLWMELARSADELYYVGRTSDFVRRVHDQCVSETHRADVLRLFDPKEFEDLRWVEGGPGEEKRTAKELVEVTGSDEIVTSSQIKSFALYR